MASFITPTTANESTFVLAPGPFLLYSNSILPYSQLFETWYQTFNLIFGVVAFSLPLLRSLYVWLKLKFLEWKGERRRKKQDVFSHPSKAPTKAKVAKAGKKERIQDPFQPVTSFHFHTSGDLDAFLLEKFEVHIVDTEKISQRPAIEKHPASLVFGRLDEAAWRHDFSMGRDLKSHVDDLVTQTGTLKNMQGVALSTQMLDVDDLGELLRDLAAENIDVILIEDCETPKATNFLHLACGIIFKNGCVLPNGMRRDFFQAATLRKALAKASYEREINSTFLIGFIDLWHERPHPATIRRSVKFAKFHDAVFYHASISGDDKGAPHQAALSAFDILKRDDLIETQKGWVNVAVPEFSFDESKHGVEMLSTVEAVLPGICQALRPVDYQPQDWLDSVPVEPALPLVYKFDAPQRPDFWTYSSLGKPLSFRGCYDLREELFDEHYLTVLETQLHLLRIDMLTQLPGIEADKVCVALLQIPKSALHSDLVMSLCSKIRNSEVVVYQGIDTGFTLPDQKGHFWAVSHEDGDGKISIFMSLKSPDLTSTVLHAYLAHQGVPRVERFEAELNVLTAGKAGAKHPRVFAELAASSYSELLTMIQQVKISGTNHPFLKDVQAECCRLLIADTTRLAWVRSNSKFLLSGSITPAELFEQRLKYLWTKGYRQLPLVSELTILYERVNVAVIEGLLLMDEEHIETMLSPLISRWGTQEARSNDDFNASLDFYGLILFCVIRRHAFEEVYLETTDRCPLFLQQHDQAGVFSELWVLGSQCEIYFGIRPRALGAIIYDRYREYLREYEPPVEAWDNTNVFSAYSKTELSAADFAVPSEISKMSKKVEEVKATLVKTGFLAIFCLPAIIDVGLLTFLGRGLYLTAFMTLEERVMANYALLAALIMTSGVTGWSGSVGGFYLYQSAYQNMTYFMVQRIAGGSILAAVVAVAGFFRFAHEYSWYAGFVFAAYLMALSTYLNLLGVMATMHRDGSPFPSGRGAFGKCLLITLISPIVTTFFNNYDVAIYLPVLYLFLVVLIWEYGKLCQAWTVWPELIVTTKEAEIIAWYDEQLKLKPSKEENVKVAAVREPPQTKADLAARYLTKAIESAAIKSPPKSDKFLSKMVLQHPFVLWILKKESGDRPLPPGYSSTWLVQTKLALGTQQQLNRGLKQHSPYLLYRYARYDIAQSVGFFLLALLDRWVSISMSANGFVVNLYYDNRAKYGIAFGLLYFLMSAISLDIILQRYWGTTGRQSAAKLRNIFDLEESEFAEAIVQKKRWLKAFTELISVMLCLVGLTTVFCFLFVNEARQIISYYAYAVAYSGVILAQFNRVFTTDIRRHVHIVFLSALLGYVVGIILHEIPATKLFPYTDVIALCTASFSAAYGTWLWTDFCDDASNTVHLHTKAPTTGSSYAQRLIGYAEESVEINLDLVEQIQSQNIVEYQDGSDVATDLELLLKKALNMSRTKIRNISDDSEKVVRAALDCWSSGQMKLVVLSRDDFVAVGWKDRFATSFFKDKILHVYVGMPDLEQWQTIGEKSWKRLLVQVLAESVLHETCEAILGMSHAEATISELVLNGCAAISTRMAIQLAWTGQASLESLVYRTNAEVLRHLALGIDLDVGWIDVPENVRQAVLSRVAGRSWSMTAAVQKWLDSHFRPLASLDLSVQQCLAIYQVAHWRLGFGGDPSRSVDKDCEPGLFTWSFDRGKAPAGFREKTMGHVETVYNFLFFLVEYVAIVSTAGTDCGKELYYALRHSKLRTPFLLTVLKIWKLCSWIETIWLRIVLLNKKPIFKKYHECYKRGVPRVLTQGAITDHDPQTPMTGFFHDGPMPPRMSIYTGALTVAPKGDATFKTATYDQHLRLCVLESITRKGDEQKTTEQTTYVYDQKSKSKRNFPLLRKTTIADIESMTFYDKYGRISHGTTSRGGRQYQFSYVYETRAKASSKLLNATFISVDLETPTAYTVFWSATRDANGVDPRAFSVSERVQRVVKSVGNNREVIVWNWNHKRDPVIVHDFYNPDGQTIYKTETVSSYKDDFGSFAKPTNILFQQEDLLYFHSKRSILKEINSVRKAALEEDEARRPSDLTLVNDTADVGTLVPLSRRQIISDALRSWYASLRLGVFFAARFQWVFSRKSKIIEHVPVATWKIRTALWKEWTSRTDLDACTCCYLDEMMLREEPLMQRYWQLRDAGYFAEAKTELYDNMDAIIAATEIMDDVAQKISLSIRMSDLFVMGLSKDANFVTPAPEERFIDTENRLAVIFTDTGCWPDAPGGVSNCRRDLIDGHTTIRNYALSESANEFGIPRFQIERSIQAIKNMPLWGLDGKSPSHGLLDNLLQTQVETRLRQTSIKDIQTHFIPLLKSFIRGARSRNFSKADIAHFTKVILKMNRYFEEYDYLKSWQCKETRQAFKEAWLVEYDDPNVRNPNDCFAIEQPTALNFDEAMGLYISYFFILSVRLPEVVPRVYQSTHHGISSLWGMCLKLRRGTTWGIWDHAILWRETCLNISVAQCILPVSVQTMLLGAMKVAAHLAYTHADVILPCTAVFNPIWEVELGTDEGRRGSQNVFFRKIDPVTNGISSMDSFKPVEKIKSAHPTAVMLSNVQFIKDVKNAIVAAGVIINDFGFKTYHLVVYGAQDREPSYAVKTEGMISSLGISKTVKLGGFGRPAVVLQEAWLFMNSSLSEGLPLAIGEAALSGCPIVATEVGATAQVLTDIYDPNIRYGEVVPPNDPVALARAQIAILAMVGPWAKYATSDTEPPRQLPTKFTPEDVAYFTQRMHDKTEDRRKLGLKLREVVLAKFNGDRYLREHEQMYWAHRHIAKQREDKTLQSLQRMYPGFPVTPKYVEVTEQVEGAPAARKSFWDEPKWQEFR